MASAFHVGDVGAAIVLEIKEGGVILPGFDGAADLQIEIKRPDATTLDKAAVFTTDGTDAKMQYVTIAGDLDQSGQYEVQGYFTLGAWTGRTERKEFEVFANAV